MCKATESSKKLIYLESSIRGFATHSRLNETFDSLAIASRELGQDRVYIHINIIIEIILARIKVKFQTIILTLSLLHKYLKISSNS